MLGNANKVFLGTVAEDGVVTSILSDRVKKYQQAFLAPLLGMGFILRF
jgi:hypothetical protein